LVNNDKDIDLSRDYSRVFLVNLTISIVFLVICLVAASFLRITNVDATLTLLIYGIIYFVMSLTAFLLFNRHVGSDDLTLTIIGVAAGTGSLFILSAAFGALNSALTGNPFSLVGLGMLKITAENGATGATQLSLFNMNSSQLFTLLLNIPGPGAEECFFRIFLWRMYTLGMGKFGAQVAQSVTFGVIHYFAYGFNIMEMLLAICCGLALGLIYQHVLHGKNEIAIVLSHLIYNLYMLLFGGA
jgi:membrane protease YdiL (CAAX protease family)